MPTLNLRVDPERWTLHEKLKDDEPSTGIYVRAWSDKEARMVSADIMYLTAESLLTWLRSRGGYNPWAEDVVGILMGHGHISQLVIGELKNDTVLLFDTSVYRFIDLPNPEWSDDASALAEE